MSAIVGKADMTQRVVMSANDPERTSACTAVPRFASDVESSTEVRQIAMKPLDLSGRRNSTFTNWFTRDQNDELISIDLGVSGDVRAQLLCKRGDDPHSQSFTHTEVKVGG